jgi:hypothetical protein
MVVDDGVNERVPGSQIARDPAASGSKRRGGPVLVSLRSSDEPPTTAVRNVAQFLHVDMDQRAWCFVLVAASRLTRTRTSWFRAKN